MNWDMDTPWPQRHTGAMRFLILPLLLCLAGCVDDPAKLGITGPGQVEAPKPREDAVPGGDITMPQSTPNTGSGRYFGYN